MTSSPGASHDSRIGRDVNERTMISPLVSLSWSGKLLRAGFELLAGEAFAKIDPGVDGIVVAAASPSSGERAGGLYARREAGRLWSGLLGRHDATSLSLPSDSALSLRHAILIARVTDDGCPIFRALDLRSGTGMFDASGAPHRSVIANGPLRLRVGNSALFAIPTGDLFRDGRVVPYDDLAWPEPERWLPDAPPERRLGEISGVTTRSAMMSLEGGRARRLLRGGADHPQVGRFVVDIGGLCSEIAVDDVALRKGILFGRYSRCDINCENAPMSELISRVHALFLMVDESLRVFDTGSTNGIGHGDGSASGLELVRVRDTRLSLGADASITWCPAASSSPGRA
ncbi:MAG: FHA domain-containing protein [Proteobacteria bacterium]|jgi:hypothetical protein|nr:FHA domain-containing protein [Pseudomonadota bacterium]